MAVSYNNIKVVTLKLHKTLANIAFKKKVIFNGLTWKCAIVNYQQKEHYSLILKRNLNKHGRDLCKLIISLSHLLDKLKSLSGNTLLKVVFKKNISNLFREMIP